MDSSTQNATLTDFAIPDQIEDTISQMRFMPSKNSMVLATCGWDTKLRVWNVNYALSSGMTTTATVQTNQFLNSAMHDVLLSLCWQGETGNLFTGCGDGSIYMVDLNNQGRSQVLGKHELGCKELIWDQNHGVLLSGGWDGKLNFWDLRSQNPCMQLDLGKKIYTMSMTYPLLVVGLSDRIITYFNLNKLGGTGFGAEAMFESHLRYQTRRVATFPEGDGYAIGSIEGRVAIKYVDLNKQPEINPETKSMVCKEDFAFRCHRAGEGLSEVYPVNDIAFNPVYGTFCTGGGDGTWIIWDKDSRSRLRQGFQSNKAPLTALDYSYNGDLLAYATGYDWSKGVAYEGSFTPKINIHYCPDSDKKKKPKK